MRTFARLAWSSSSLIRRASFATQCTTMAPPSAASDHFSSGANKIGGIGVSGQVRTREISPANKAFSGLPGRRPATRSSNDELCWRGVIPEGTGKRPLQWVKDANDNFGEIKMGIFGAGRRGAGAADARAARRRGCLAEPAGALH